MAAEELVDVLERVDCRTQQRLGDEDLPVGRVGVRGWLLVLVVLAEDNDTVSAANWAVLAIPLAFLVVLVRASLVRNEGPFSGPFHGQGHRCWSSVRLESARTASCAVAC